jgi:hypothetical protein
VLWLLCVQVSGYIDYAHRLKTDPNMSAYFERTRRFMPRHTDLSFYNWETHLSTSNLTPNFQVCVCSVGMQIQAIKCHEAIIFSGTLFTSYAFCTALCMFGLTLRHVLTNSTCLPFMH